MYFESIENICRAAYNCRVCKSKVFYVKRVMGYAMSSLYKGLCVDIYLSMSAVHFCTQWKSTVVMLRLQ